jgi:hypothetical protein
MDTYVILAIITGGGTVVSLVGALLLPVTAAQGEGEEPIGILYEDYAGHEEAVAYVRDEDARVEQEREEYEAETDYMEWLAESRADDARHGIY